MIKISEKKLLYLIPIIAVVIAFIFSFIVTPLIYMKPKEIPIAIVNYDEGLKTAAGDLLAGQQMIKQIKENSINSTEKSPVKWIEITNENDLNQGFKDKKYYAALIITKDFSKNQASLKTIMPVSPTIQIKIDQGQDISIANSVETTLTSIVANTNKTMQTALLKTIQNTKKVITDEQASTLITPIKTDIEYLNKIGDNLANGAAHRALFLITWISALIASILMYFYISKTTGNNKKEIIKSKLIKVLYGAIVSLILGLIIAFIGKIEFNFAIPYITTAIFTSVAIYSLMLLIIGFLCLTGIGGILLFSLLMFMGMITINIPYELLPEFWQTWVYPWIPMRFLSSGLNDIFYLNSSAFNLNTIILIFIGLTGLILFSLSFLKKIKK